jgi:DNA repair ATPase RecN
MLAKRIFVIVIAAALGATLAAPLVVAENTRSEPKTEAQNEIANRLDSFESSAAALQKQTDNYASSVRANRPQRDSHVRQLSITREQVNYLGRELSELEELSSQATELQQMAIEEIRPHLQAVADHVQSAIVMLNESHQVHRTPEFQETVIGIYEHADDLYTKVDAITDYERARERAASMNAISES